MCSRGRATGDIGGGGGSHGVVGGPLTNRTVSWWGRWRTVAAPVNRTDAHGRLFSDLTNFKDVYAKPARDSGVAGVRGRFRNPLSFIRLLSDLSPFRDSLTARSLSVSFFISLFLSFFPSLSLLIPLVLGSLKMINLIVCFRSLSRYSGLSV